MINRECVYKTIKGYLPTAEEDLVVYLTTQAEKQIEILGRDVIRRLVLPGADKGPVLFASRIDTKV
ncbi:hypothetical protein [Anaeroselena agilis]|uniref:Uncharacterized protein n=1 Tax=Anaeroselena agilis TaxID=3063788 RepID=A0ABU3P724_9FIRM|nr:hypothetical protein [Selenomonadales bacterium 4137-cl]